MSNVECRDIFNAVYINVRASYIESLYSSKKKVKILNGNSCADELEEKTDVAETNFKTTRLEKQGSSDSNETITESVERFDESEVAGRIGEDLEEKFPFVLAAACSNLATIDKAYRKMKGLDEQPGFCEYILETSDIFPLCDRFVYPCIMYVSSMVLIDINEQKSDDFYEKYASLVSGIVSELPCELTSVVEKYPY